MQTIDTLAKALTAMGAYAGGSVPAITDDAYLQWVLWINSTQEDAAERGFWSRLLTKATLTITATDTATLPTDFHKRNGIYVLEVDGVDWNENANTAGQRLFVNKDDTGDWVVTFKGYTPTLATTGTLWYFRHPGILSDQTDPIMLDGKMCVYGALTEYFRQAGELGSLDDARAEYNNRFEESLGLEMLPSPQELLSWKSYSQHINQNPNEHAYYSRNRRRI
jgi:hypothetical protein